MKTGIYLVLGLVVLALAYSWWSSKQRTVTPPAISGTGGGGGGLLDSLTNASRQTKGLLDSIFGKPAAPKPEGGSVGFV